MKYFFTLLLLSYYYVNAQNSINIAVNTTDTPNTVYCILVKQSNGKVLLEKRGLKNFSSFSFSLIQNEPVYINIDLNNTKDSSLTSADLILVTNDSIQVAFNDTNKPGKVTGGENDFLEYNFFGLFGIPYSVTKDPAFTERNIKTNGKYTPTDGGAYARYIEYKKNLLRTVRLYNNYYTVLASLNNNAKTYLDIETLDSTLKLLTDTLKKTKIGKEYVAYVENRRKLTTGNIFPIIQLVDSLGNSYTSNAFVDHNKYTLVELWASWCVPCIQMMEKIKLIYDQINKEKIQIISLNVDKEKKNWLNARKKYILPWKDYADASFNMEIFNPLNLHFIPSSVLLDPSGKIIQWDLTEEELKQFLYEKKFIMAH